MKYTFHLPVHDHDEVDVAASNLDEACDRLQAFIDHGEHSEYVAINRLNIDDGDARYWSEEVNECPVFDENGDQID